MRKIRDMDVIGRKELCRAAAIALITVSAILPVAYIADTVAMQAHEAERVQETDDALGSLAALDAAREKVERSNADWKAAQQRAMGVRNYAVTGSGDGSWHVSYRGTDDRSSANADGSVSEWMDGYYIAHDWSYGGGQIASKPGTVVVNGRTYRYVSSMVVPRSTTWDEVSGFVYANGGIGFQTCYGSGYLITHYEPV